MKKAEISLSNNHTNKVKSHMWFSDCVEKEDWTVLRTQGRYMKTGGGGGID